MPKLHVEVQLSPDELLKAVEQLSLPDLEQFISQVLSLQIKRKGCSLPLTEVALLLAIGQVIPSDTQKHYDELVNKRQAEILTTEEQSQLIQLTEQIEKIQARRIEYLAELARLCRTSLPALMEKLGIQIPEYV